MNENLEELKDQLGVIDQIFDGVTSDADSFGDEDYERIISEFGLDIRKLNEDMEGFQPTMDLRYSKSNIDAVTPEYAYPTDSGFDLRSTENVVIESFGRALIPTGLHFDIPDGYEIQVRSKSGLALKQGLMVLNSPGTVDFSYTGEIKVILFNTSREDIIIQKGQKIAQGVLCPVVSGKWLNLVEVDNIEDKERSDNGFGSTGI